MKCHQRRCAYSIGNWMIRRRAERLLAIVLAVILVQGLVPAGPGFLAPPQPVLETARSNTYADIQGAASHAAGAVLESADPVSHPMVETSITRLSPLPTKRDGDGGDGDTSEKALLLFAALAAVFGLVAPDSKVRLALPGRSTDHGAGRPCEAGRCPTGPPAIT